MNLFTSKMKLLTAIVLEKHADAVTREILRQGVLDFVSVNTFSREDAELLQTYHGKLSRTTVSDLRKRIENLCQQADLTLPPSMGLDVKELVPFKIEDYQERLDKLNRKLMDLREDQKNINQEILKLQEMRKYLGEGDGGKGRDKDKSEYLSIRAGSPQRGKLEDLERSLRTISHFMVNTPRDGGAGSAGASGGASDGIGTPDSSGTPELILVSLRREAALMEEVLQKYDWVEALPALRPAEEDALISKELDLRLETLKQNQADIQRNIRGEIQAYKPELDSMWRNLRLNELYSQIQESFSQTSRTVVFSGWLPEKAAGPLEEGIRRASGGECVIQWAVPEGYPRDKVPVAVKTSKALAPFQMLVRNFAVPEYGSVNPTPFVAAAYLCMFGLMFADAGQGLVISLIGMLGVIRNRRIGKAYNLFQLFIYCGFSSVAAGVLFGSYFGYELFPPVWFNYHAVVLGHGDGPVSSIYGILKITIYFGIVVIFMGLIINWINLARKKAWFPLFLDKSGITGGWLYGCGIYAAFYFVGTGYRQLPPGLFVPLAFGIPVVILLFKAPLHHFLDPEARSHGFKPSLIMDFIMEWLVEILEIFSGYLANTLSFMRVAGLGIAHVSLMSAFASIAEMAGGGIQGILIQVLGNALVIALEGLSAGIQALRLNYYEFFSRYFTGKGIAYSPISLK